MDTRARAVLRSLKTYRPGTSVDEARRTHKVRSVIKLASNENALGPSPKALRALQAATTSLHVYPDATCRALRARLAKHLRVDVESLLIGNGSDELIVLALRALVDPGDRVVVARPTFLIYELQAKASGASVSIVPLRDLRYDLPAMKAAVTPKTKLVFIANPDNPTGTYVRRQELRSFLRGLPRQVTVFMDEAYYEFVEAKDYPQTLREFKDAPLIVTRSFSKAYGLAGLRVGYAIAAPGLIAAMEALREPFNVNSLAQVAACAALDDTVYLRRARHMVRTGRAYLTRELVRLGLRVIPSVTNFVLVKVGPKAPQVADRLLREGVIVREMSAWDLRGFLRITVGTMPDNRRFLKALHKSLPR